ncbi:hypothetical protein HOLleu_24175 [Holothuria leucospilota]|uniref:Secreted protein n=1 Tax=Holothuria leucospilota TaxID=206669 RepID=A0A9Q1BV22_HOLLE|nr:hypothetical protein HOLleu_24175 [Holothuria leucospilota]
MVILLLSSKFLLQLTGSTRIKGPFVTMTMHTSTPYIEQLTFRCQPSQKYMKFYTFVVIGRNKCHFC